MSFKSDEELLKLLKMDNQAALEDLFEKYYYQLCEFSVQYVKNYDLSEEIVSDVFLKVWINRQKLNITNNFKSYIYIATRNQSLNYIKKESLDSIDHNFFIEDLISTKYLPDEELIFQELENQIKIIINTLPPRRKLIFKLSRIEGFTYREIANILSISIHTVQNQMVQAVKQIASYSTLKY
jgi:RNA polymerase sigma-70 factor (ECF subfamily)